jgi:hypothetical protein
MIVQPHKLVYFAYPKCASEWMRRELGLKKHLNRHLDFYNWDTCSINYCHCKPYRFVNDSKLSDDYSFFTMVRNPYERLVSCWAYSVELDRIYKKETFTEFVDYLYSNKDNLHNVPCCWMILPYNQYFEGVIEKVQVFKVENIQECINYLQENFNIEVRNYKCNTSQHDHYTQYYTKDTRKKIEEIYAWELERFGYEF